MERDELDFISRWQQQRMNNSGCLNPTFIIIAVIALFLFSSCVTRTKIEYRDRDVNHYITNTVHDTLKVETKDSVYYEVIQKGDTIYKTKYKYVDRWRDRVVERTDTCWRDSITVEYKEKVKEVKKIPTIYKWSMGLSIIMLIFAGVKLYRWIKK